MTKLIVVFRNFAKATKTYVIEVFSSGIFFISGFIISDHLVQKLRLMDKRITYIETTWRSEFQLSEAGKVRNEDAASRCPLRLGPLYCVFREQGTAGLHSMTAAFPGGAGHCVATGVWGFCPKLWWELTNTLLRGVSP